MKRSGKQVNIEAMSASQINKLLDRYEKESSEITDEFIQVGRGLEKPTETFKKDDLLARKYIANYNMRSRLRSEIERRYGPGAPARLPRGFGPIKKI